MNKYLLFLISLFFSSVALAQNGNTGINTKTPHANLDVQAVTSNNGIADGIISPRVTKANLISKTGLYNTDQTSAIVYVTDATAASTDAKFTNIDEVGYYYFDGSIWIKMRILPPTIQKWDLNGNTITAGQFLGTLNPMALQFKYNNANAGFLNDLNTSYGYNALPFTTIGNDNAAFGKNVLSANTTGYLNTAIGNNALSKNTVGYANTAIGLNALSSNVTHRDNVAIGTYALQANTANNNVAIGSGAMKSNTSGNLNVAIGLNALAASTNTNGSTAVGGNALQSSTGASNTAIGSSSLGNNLGGYSNTAIGQAAASANTSGFENIAIGKSSLSGNVSGNKNIGIGGSTLTLNLVSSDNIAIGASSLNNFRNNADSISTYNVALGGGSGVRLVTGKNNTFLGARSGVTAGGSADLNYGIIIGAQAMVTGDNSSAVGGQTSVSGSSSTVLGSKATVVGINSTAIGAGAVATGNNLIVLGRTNGTGNVDNVGIGTVTPANALHIKSAANPLKLEGVQVPTVSGAYSMLVIGADGVVYQAPSGTGIVIAGLTPVKDDSILLATIAKQAEQIKLLTESLAELKNTVNALSPTYTAQNK